MDRYDLKLKKNYAEMRDHEKHLAQKCLYMRVLTTESEETISPEHVSMSNLTKTLQSMVNIIRTQHKRINDLEKILHTDLNNKT
jgi:vacuolar-type H+-ATPase subunit D/Vma8